HADFVVHAVDLRVALVVENAVDASLLHEPDLIERTLHRVVEALARAEPTNGGGRGRGVLMEHDGARETDRGDARADAGSGGGHLGEQRGRGDARGEQAEVSLVGRADVELVDRVGGPGSRGGCDADSDRRLHEHRHARVASTSSAPTMTPHRCVGARVPAMMPSSTTPDRGGGCLFAAVTTTLLTFGHDGPLLPARAGFVSPNTRALALRTMELSRLHGRRCLASLATAATFRRGVRHTHFQPGPTLLFPLSHGSPSRRRGRRRRV